MLNILLGVFVVNLVALALFCSFPKLFAAVLQGPKEKGSQGELILETEKLRARWGIRNCFYLLVVGNESGKEIALG